MQILNSLNNTGDIAIAIGFFDGVHIAHKKVISSCVDYAQKNHLKSAVLTFREHPCVSVWHVNPQYINTYEQRIENIKKLGVDYLFVLNFNEEICNTSAQNFLETLSSTVNPRAIFTGFNFFFGKNKSGNPKLLSDNASQLGYKYFEIQEEKLNNTTISSTNIRSFIHNGEILKANELLGYDFSFISKVIRGKQLGRTIDFPTINLIYPKTLIIPKYGVYSVCIEINGEEYKGIMNFGQKPTVSNNSELTVEIHILNFDKNIYDEFVTVYPQNFIREQKKFDSLDELKNQITNDILKIT